MAAKESEQQVTLKLMINKERNKVVFAEAGKDFVDALVSFLTLPLGTIIRLLNKESHMQPVEVGSLSSLYQSVENLENKYLCTDTCKEMLLRPRNSMEAYCKNLKLNIDDTEPTKYFVCNNLFHCRHNSPVLLSTFKDKKCRCGDLLAKPISPESSTVFDGFVKSNATCVISDDLNIMPNSLETMFFQFKNCGIENMSHVNEMSVNVTKNQMMDLLKSCLLSKTTLTDFFLEKKPVLHSVRKIKFPGSDFNGEGSRKINVKIIQRKSNGEILFAEGKEDFADFLFSILTFPLASVVQLMEGYSSMVSIDGLYKSIVDLDEDYWITKEVKNKLVDPGLAPQFKLSNQLLPIYESEVPKCFCYTKHSFYNKESLIASYLISTCRQVDIDIETCTASVFVDPISGTENGKRYAKGPTMYMVTDDLIVMPMSSMSVISLLNSMNIPFSDLEEKVVSIGIREGVSILQASLTSTSALTTGLSPLLTEVKEENEYPKNKVIT